MYILRQAGSSSAGVTAAFQATQELQVLVNETLQEVSEIFEGLLEGLIGGGGKEGIGEACSRCAFLDPLGYAKHRHGKRECGVAKRRCFRCWSPYHFTANCAFDSATGKEANALRGNAFSVARVLLNDSVRAIYDRNKNWVLAQFSSRDGFPSGLNEQSYCSWLQMEWITGSKLTNALVVFLAYMREQANKPAVPAALKSAK